jgi:hypothetical protein
VLLFSSIDEYVATLREFLGLGFSLKNEYVTTP